MFLGQTSAPTQPEAKYPAEMIRKACRNFEKFCVFGDGEAFAEWIDMHSMKVPDWADADVAEYIEIEESKKRWEANSLIGGCPLSSGDRILFPLVEKTGQGLNAMSPSECVLIDVTADSEACEKVMPKGLCPNIAFKESEASRAGVEYEVASGKAVPKLSECHCEIFCEGVGASMMMHSQVADIHRPLLSLSGAAEQGFRSHIGWYGGYLEDMRTGRTIPFQRRGNLYVMQIWFRGSSEHSDPKAGFVWQR